MGKAAKGCGSFVHHRLLPTGPGIGQICWIVHGSFVSGLVGETFRERVAARLFVAFGRSARLVFFAVFAGAPFPNRRFKSWICPASSSTRSEEHTSELQSR